MADTFFIEANKFCLYDGEDTSQLYVKNFWINSNSIDVIGSVVFGFSQIKASESNLIYPINYFRIVLSSKFNNQNQLTCSFSLTIEVSKNPSLNKSLI